MKRLFKFVTLSEALLFTRNPRNRNIDKGHLKDIKKQMAESFETMPPITVNSVTLHIIDGQHRLEAFKQLIEEGTFHPSTTLAVMFVEIPLEKEFGAIVEAQDHTRGWNLNDYVHSYINDGNQNYIALDDWCRVHSLTANPKDPVNPRYRYGAILMLGVRGKTTLKNGTFVVTEEELAEANQVHDEVVKIIEAFGINFKGVAFENMLISWYKHRGLNKFTDVRRYIKTHCGGLRKMSMVNASDWDAVFSYISTNINLKKVV